MSIAKKSTKFLYVSVNVPPLKGVCTAPFLLQRYLTCLQWQQQIRWESGSLGFQISRNTDVSNVSRWILVWVKGAKEHSAASVGVQSGCGLQGVYIMLWMLCAYSYSNLFIPVESSKPVSWKWTYFSKILETQNKRTSASASGCATEQGRL